MNGSSRSKRFRLPDSARTKAVSLAIIAFAGIASFTACSDLVAPRSHLPSISGRHISMDLICPECSDDENAKIQGAITNLKNDQDPDCHDAGVSLQQHFDDGHIHKYSAPPGEYGYTNINQDNSPIYVSQNAFNPGELANTMSHEESHHWGYEDPGRPNYHSNEDANAFGDYCAGAI